MKLNIYVAPSFSPKCHFKLFDAQFQLLFFLLALLLWHFFLDSPEHLLTVILAPGSADTDCQRDVSFLLFISSFPERCRRTQVSLFSLEAEGGGGLGVGGRVFVKTVGGG